MKNTDEWTLVHLVRQQATQYGDRIYMTFEQGDTLTYKELDQRTDCVATALTKLGVVSGDRVLVLIKNRIEFILSLLGVQKIGAIFVPINTELKGAFLEHQMRNSEPKVVLVDAMLVDAFEGVEIEQTILSHTVVTAGDFPPAIPAILEQSEKMTFSALEALGEKQPAPDFFPKPHQTAAIMYTSGTTGPAKGVIMPHGHFYLFCRVAMEKMQLTENDVYYVCMPIFHVNGLLMQVLASLLVGAKVHLVERFSPNRWLAEVIESQATLTNLLGVMPEFLYKNPPSDQDRAHQLRAVMAIPISKEWGADFKKRFGVKILQGFGMTECNMCLFGNLEEEELIPGCTGYVMDEYFEVQIVDPETDNPVPTNEVGELVIRPKLANCFSAGYYKMPEKTIEAWRNLWFHSGDAAKMDEQGRVHYIDRLKDCIRRRGENISAFEVEQIANLHPQVAESAVVGVKVAEAGGEEEVKAVLVTNQGSSLDPVEFLDFCVERMPRYAVPRFIEMTDSLDKTASGKLRKQALRDQGITPNTWDRQSVGYTIARR